MVNTPYEIWLSSSPSQSPSARLAYYVARAEEALEREDCTDQTAQPELIDLLEKDHGQKTPFTAAEWREIADKLLSRALRGDGNGR